MRTSFCRPGIIAVTAIILTAALPAAAQETGLRTPTLQVDIPTVRFSDAVKAGENFSVGWLGEYIAGIYQYGIGIIGILAAIVIMGAGTMWLLAGGNAGRVSEAKEWIKAAVTGLILALTSYTILYALSPGLVTLEPIETQVITSTWSEENYRQAVSTFTPPGSGAYRGDNDWRALIETTALTTPEAFRAALANHYPNSPLMQEADAIIQAAQATGIDPALALAIWIFDSSAGTKGAGATNKNPGNVTAGGRSGGTVHNVATGEVVGSWQANGRWRNYSSHEAAVHDWFRLLSTGRPYQNTRTVSDIINIYAPPSENNTQRYVNVIMGIIDRYNDRSLTAP